jgi:hypothetical protein
MFVPIGMVALNRPWHPVFIGWGGIALVELVESIFESLNRIRFVNTCQTGMPNQSDQSRCDKKSRKFQIL